MRFRAYLGGVLTGALALSALPATGSAGQPGPAVTAVVAVIDTGINPYHVTFRDDSPRAYKHPSTYIPGFPKDAKALRISLGERDYWTAVSKDCKKVWSKVVPGELYWFPGTKIIGSISFNPPTTANCALPEPSGASILDYGAHGTMTASRAASVEYGACKDCRVVMVQGFSSESVEWAADNADWIDAQSNSWGPFLPIWDPAVGGLGLWNDPDFVSTVESAAKKHLSFWASGNGTLTRFGAVGHPTIVDPRMTPSIVMVGGHDSGYINTWPDFPPHVVSDSCNSWAAYQDKIEESADDVGGGTSGAAPFAAGEAAQILIEARRILGDTGTGVTKGSVAQGPKGLVSDGPLTDGRFTLDEWKEVVFKTATPRPKRQHEDGSVCDQPLDVPYNSLPIKWEDVPEGYPEFLHIGYGAVDAEAISLALKVIGGRESLPDRSTTDQYFELDAIARAALHDVYDGP
jgi:hypothetical protein